MTETKYLLPESAIPTRWYNIAADLPNAPQPVLHPGTGEPIGPDDLAPLFPMALILQEVSQDAELEIPEAILDVYRLWRPTPLYRARRLEQASWERARASSTSTRASARRAATSRTPRSRRRTTSRRTAGRESPPRPAPVSGAAPSRSPRSSSGSSARSTWSRSRTSRSRTGAR